MKQKILFIFFSFCTLVSAFPQNTNDSLLIDSIIRELPEVLVKGERPVAVVNGNAITYNLPVLIEKRGVDNVYDAIKYIPGIIEQDGAYQLAGRGVNIALNGQLLTIPKEQLVALLQSIPAGRIEKTDVLYSAPAYTQVRGALVNIRLKQETTQGAPLEGEFNLAYNQKHRALFGERASILYHKGKVTIDAMYLHKHGREYGITDETSSHSLNDGIIYDINNRQTQLNKVFGHNFRIDLNYDFAKNHALSVSYQGSHDSKKTFQDYSGNIEGTTTVKQRPWLHDIRIDYTLPFGMKVGAEATYYHNPEDQELSSVLPTGALSCSMENDQRVNTGRIYLSQKHQLKNDWSINYGLWYKYSVNHSAQRNNNDTDEQDAYLRQTEDIVNVYAGLGKSWNNKIILDASLAAEYYHTQVWHQWHAYPTIGLTYVHNSDNVWLLNFNTDRSYPEYWVTNNFTVYGNGGYNEITGNPYLKPSSKYHTQLVYVLKRKFQFAAWFNHTKDYFAQTPYQTPERLAIIFRNLNFNYQQQVGLQAVLPQKIGRWLDSRLTLTGVWMREKCDNYYDIPFDRAIFFCMGTLNNTITLFKQPDISLTVDGMLRTKAHQAIYDIPASGYLNLGVNWYFWKKRANLHFFCNDIFETSQPNSRIDYKGQKLRMDFSSYRQVGVSLTVRFGGYKGKKHEEIDTSRFRK